MPTAASGLTGYFEKALHTEGIPRRFNRTAHARSTFFMDSVVGISQNELHLGSRNVMT